MAGELGGPSSHSSGGRRPESSQEKPSPAAVDEFAQRFRDATDNMSDIQLADLAETGKHHVKPRLEQVDSPPPRQPSRPGAAFRPPEASITSGGGGRDFDASANDHGATVLRSDQPPELMGGGIGLELDDRPLRGAMSGPGGAEQSSSEAGSAQAGVNLPSLVAGSPSSESPAGTALVARTEGGLPATRASSSMTAHVSLISPAPLEERVSLFGTDRLTGALIGLAIGLLVGLGPAWAWSQSLLDRSSMPLIVELEDVIERPLMVRAGKIRAPSEVAAEIQGHYGPARSRFWWTWLGFAAVFTAGLGIPSRRPRG